MCTDPADCLIAWSTEKDPMLGAIIGIHAYTTARLASHDLGTPMKWPKMSMHDETARRPDGMVTMHVSCKRIDHQSTQSDGMPCMMHDPRQPLETPNFRYAGRDFSN